MARRTAARDAACLLLVVAVAAVAAADAMARPSARVDKVKENYNRVLALMKKGPQPRAIEVKQVLQGVSPLEEVHPHQTVLHRCDEIACCGMMPNPQQHRCRVQEETVTLYFHATVAGTRKQRSIQQQFQNHTRCECVLQAEQR